ncbi:MAG: SAM-dependent methyltransferase, partial [Bdellovibrionia bacterium]
MAKKRLDILMLEKGLVSSRERAQGLILAGKVLVNDEPQTKPGHSVLESSQIRIRGGEEHPYVSRGGTKLEAALDAFGVNVKDKVALDIGASTGGFTHVLLLRGAQRVHAVDVGHSQMDWQIRSNP